MSRNFPLFFLTTAPFWGLGGGLCSDLHLDRNDRAPDLRQSARWPSTASGVAETPGAQAALSITVVEIGTVIKYALHNTATRNECCNNACFPACETRHHVRPTRPPCRFYTGMVNNPSSRQRAAPYQAGGIPAQADMAMRHDDAAAPTRIR